MNTVIRIKPLLVHLTVPVLVGMGAAYLSGNTLNFYYSIELPYFALSTTASSVVWIVLYLLMGLSSYLIYTHRGIPRGDRKWAIALYGFALLANCLWNFLFYSFRMFTLAACWIWVVFAVMTLCAALFYRIRHLAGVLMIPTLGWLVFAGILNASIATLN